jgi:hypothetical protein
MNRDNKFPINLDSVAGLAAGALLLSITLAIWVGSRAGVRITAELPADSIISPFEMLTFKFAEPVDGALAAEKFFIQPEIVGSYRWADEKTLQFIPREPFQPNTVYTLAFAPGALTANGRQLKETVSWDVKVRPPLVAYIVAEQGQGRLWAVEPQSGKTSPITDASLKVFDFDVAYSGEFIVFSAFNEQGGVDLWRVGRAGGNPVLLVQCGPDRCTVPAVSNLDRRVAYVREAASPSPDLDFGAPRIWVLDLETRQNAPLYEDQQIIGYRPVWSPDGTRISSYDGLADELRLLDLVTGNQLIIPSQTGSPVTWSADGDTFVFTDIRTNESGSFSQVRQAKLVTSEIITLVGDKDERDYHYNSLAWSPAENSLVIGLRFDEKTPLEALWLIDPVTLGGQVIADQPEYTYNNPQWDPWGRALVFQQFKIRGIYTPEIGLWMPGFDEPRTLAEGIMPQWVP